MEIDNLKNEIDSMENKIIELTEDKESNEKVTDEEQNLEFIKQ